MRRLVIICQNGCRCELGVSICVGYRTSHASGSFRSGRNVAKIL